MILYDPKGEAVRTYQTALQRLCAKEDTAVDFGDVSTAYYAWLFRKAVRRALEAELSDPEEQPRVPSYHCLMCMSYHGQPNGAHL